MNDLRVLSTLMRHLLDENVTWEQIYASMVLTIQELDAVEEDGGDIARDACDLLTGWCAPGLSLRKWSNA